MLVPSRWFHLIGAPVNLKESKSEAASVPPSIRFLLTVSIIVPLIAAFAVFPTLENVFDPSLSYGEPFDPDGTFCQPVNGFSALAYLLPALVVYHYWTTGRLEPPSATRQPFATASVANYLFLLMSVYLCVCNLAFHLFCIPGGYNWDTSGMTWMIAFPFSRAVEKVGRRFAPRQVVFWLTFVVFVVVYDYWFRRVHQNATELYEWVVPTLIAVNLLDVASAVYRGRYSRRQYWWTWATLVLFLVAFGFQRLSEDGHAGTHAVWHVVSAVLVVSIWFMLKNDTDGRMDTTFSTEEEGYKEMAIK